MKFLNSCTSEIAIIVVANWLSYGMLFMLRSLALYVDHIADLFFPFTSYGLHSVATFQA